MTTWHADDKLLAGYAGGRVDEMAAASLEAHILACPVCRERLAEWVPASRLRANREGVLAALDAPPPGVLERLLARAGVRAGTARLLVATPTLRLSWLSAIALALAFAAIAVSRPGGAQLLVLMLAPLVPVAAVAIAFNPSLDASAEMVAATPFAGGRLLLLRAVASLVPSVVLAGIAGPAVAGGGAGAMWLLPALALSALSLALASVAPIGTVAAVLSALWGTGVVVAEAFARGSIMAVRTGGGVESVLVQLPAQLLAAIVAATAAAVVVRRSLGSTSPLGRIS